MLYITTLHHLLKRLIVQIYIYCTIHCPLAIFIGLQIGFLERYTRINCARLICINFISFILDTIR